MDINTLGIASIGAITVVCFLVGMAVKRTGKIDEWVPVICGATGAALGVLWFACGWPGMDAQEPITATATGIMSGLAATGAHQVYKQLLEDK